MLNRFPFPATTVHWQEILKKFLCLHLAFRNHAASTEIVPIKFRQPLGTGTHPKYIWKKHFSDLAWVMIRSKNIFGTHYKSDLLAAEAIFIFPSRQVQRKALLWGYYFLHGNQTVVIATVGIFFGVNQYCAVAPFFCVTVRCMILLHKKCQKI